MRELHRDNSNVYIGALCPGPVDTNFNNVAGVKFGIKPLSSDYVAEYAIKKMFTGKSVIIPGFTVKLSVFMSRFLSRKAILKLTYNVQKAKSKE